MNGLDVTVTEDSINKRAFYDESESESPEEAPEERMPQTKLNVAFQKLREMGDKVALKLATGIDKVLDKIDGIDSVEKPKPIR